MAAADYNVNHFELDLDLDVDAMPIAVEDYSRPTTPTHLANGLASPRPPQPTGRALTEYAAHPPPPPWPRAPHPQAHRPRPDRVLGQPQPPPWHRALQLQHQHRQHRRPR